MNRRAFLAGLFGTAAIAPAGPLPQAVIKAEFDRELWEKAIIEIWSNYFSDAIIFGRAAIRYIDTFPFVENVPLNEVARVEYENQFRGLAL